MPATTQPFIELTQILGRYPGTIHWKKLWILPYSVMTVAEADRKTDYHRSEIVIGIGGGHIVYNVKETPKEVMDKINKANQEWADGSLPEL